MTFAIPQDAAARRAVRPVVCYPVETLPDPDLSLLDGTRLTARKSGECLVPAREARCFRVPAGHFFRILSVDGPQVGDLNLWSADLTASFDKGGGVSGGGLAAGEGRLYAATTYGEVASHIGKPSAARAVGTAVGKNPISFVVPCHRVIGKSGALIGYHWGLTRKRAILGWEAGQTAAG